MNAEQASDKSGATRNRYWPGFLIMLCGLAVLFALHFGGLTIARPILDFTWALGAINVLLYIWLRALSGLSIRRQCWIAAGILFVQGLMFVCFRLDGFDGTGRFIAKWRWSLTPEQKLRQYDSDNGHGLVDVVLEGPGHFDSPAFRGADRDGVYKFPKEIEFSTCKFSPRWRRPIGRGWSSFSAVGDYCFTQEQLEQYESTSCYRISSGELVWQTKRRTRFDEITSGPGPRATPAFADGKIVCMGATGWLECIDATTGKLIWERHLCSRQEDEILFGFCSSPLILGRLVYVTIGKPNASLVAVDLDTGNMVWSRDNRTAGYSSPHPFKHDEGVSILVFDATGLHAYDAIDGQLQWSFDWGDNSDEQVNVCQPVVVANNQLLISSGYGRGTALLDVEQTKVGWVVRQRWVSKRLRAKFSSIVVKAGFVFGLDEGILTCLDLESGRRVWKSGRYGHGQLMLCGDWLMVQAEGGDLVLVRATEKGFEESRRISALTDRTWNYPILAGDCILLRNDREAMCFQIGE